MIKVIKQDKYKGKVFDTEIKVDVTITVMGEELKQFEEELQNLINKYRI
jgi:hypothetical protein